MKREKKEEKENALSKSLYSYNIFIMKLLKS